MGSLVQLPLWVLAAVVLVPAVLYGVGGVHLARSRGWMADPETNSAAGFVHAFVGVLFAVSLGLMVVAAQGSYAEVESSVMTEANITSDLFRDMEALPEPARSQLQGLTRRYVESVISREWPAAAKGGTSPETWAVVDSLARSIITYHPPDEHGQMVYPEVLEGIDELMDERRIRLFLGTDGIGYVTWAVVIFGALVTIGLACFFNTPSARGHYWLVGTMSAMFGLMVFQIIALDYPLMGPNGVDARPFVVVREKIDEWEGEEVVLRPLTLPAR